MNQIKFIRMLIVGTFLALFIASCKDNSNTESTSDLAHNQVNHLSASVAPTSTVSTKSAIDQPGVTVIPRPAGYYGSQFCNGGQRLVGITTSAGWWDASISALYCRSLPNGNYGQCYTVNRPAGFYGQKVCNGDDFVWGVTYGSGWYDARISSFVCCPKY